MHLATAWAQGISILLNYGSDTLVDQPDKYGYLPLTYAVMNREYDSSRLLIRAGSPLSSPKSVGSRELDEVLHFAIHFDDSPLLDLAIDSLKSRRLQLYNFAKESLPIELWERLDIANDRVLDRYANYFQKTLKDVDIEVPKALLVTQLAATVYHGAASCTLKAAHAERLFEAGFKDFDATDDEDLTPLEAFCLSSFTDRKNLEDGLGFLTWLVRKGVDLRRQAGKNRNHKEVSGVTGYHLIGHFVGRATASHILTRRTFEEDLWDVTEISNSINEFSQALVTETIRNESRDSCRCSCSKGGCSPIISMLKSLTTMQWRRNAYTTSPLREILIHWIASCLMHGESGMPFVAAVDVIRFETFETLGLTHTCCNTDEKNHRAFTQRCELAEIAEIHEEEQELIREHELLVNLFSQAYEERGESLPLFITGYWRRRMARVLMKCRPVGKDELANLRLIGVVIKDECKDYNESETRQDVDLSTDRSEENSLSEEPISDETWYRILHEYCDWTDWSDDD